MLKLFECSSHAAREELFLHTINSDGVWLVPDLASKLLLQERALSSRTLLPDCKVPRASDFWRYLLLQVMPGVHSLEKPLMLALIESWLRARHGTLEPISARNVFDFMGEFLPLLATPRAVRLAREWLSDPAHAKSCARWGSHFELCVELWKYLQSKNSIACDWVSSLLVHEAIDLSKVRLGGASLCVDMASELHSVEAEVLLKLSQNHDIKIICPSSAKRHTLWAYQSLHEHALVEQVGAPPAANKMVQTKIQTLKMGNYLAECKYAIERAQFLVQTKNLPLSAIGFVAPRFGVYAPCLVEHAKLEGLRLNWEHKSSWHENYNIMRWLACLRASIRAGDYHDFEMAFFGGQKALGSALEFKKIFRNRWEFQSGFKNLPSSHLKTLLAKGATRDPISGEQFLSWAVDFFDGDPLFLKPVLEGFLNNLSYALKLSPDIWLMYLENLCLISDFKTETQQDKAGIFCTNIANLKWAPASLRHVFVLGLVDSQMHPLQESTLGVSDVLKIQQDLGFSLNPRVSSMHECELLYLLKHLSCDWDLLCAQQSFVAEEETPNRVWLEEFIKNGGQKPDIQDPPLCAWDKLQDSSYETRSKARSLAIKSAKRLYVSLQQDSQGWQGEDWGLMPCGLRPRLSASALESFQKCPYKFLASKIWGLKDEPADDLGPSYLSEGNFLHALLRRLLEKTSLTTKGASYKDKEQLIEHSLCAAIKEAPLGFLDESLWPHYKAIYAQFAKNFLQAESDLRSAAPHMKPWAFELELSAFIDPSVKALWSEGEGFKFKAHIDRVDYDAKNASYRIFDYKRSLSKHTNWGSWLKSSGESQYQLLLYLLVMEQALPKHLPRGCVKETLYYGLKDFNCNKGLRIAEQTKARGATCSKEDFHKLKQSFFAALRSHMQNILKGAMHPKPCDKSICKQCEWRAQCRATHLM